MVTIVNYGMGNLGSVKNMFKRIGTEAHITDKPEEIERAQKILLPGVGSFDAAVKSLTEKGFKEILDHKALVEKIPILGICLGMQLLTRGSEEGQLPGFGWIPASTVSFPRDRKELKVPHMGWNTVKSVHSSPLTKGFNEDFQFYFVHSYHVKVDAIENSLLKSFYGVEFDSAICKDNIFGTQFHPEKSHRFGMKVLENFSAL